MLLLTQGEGLAICSLVIISIVFPHHCLRSFMANRYGVWLDTNTVVPTGPRSCNVIFDYFIEESSGLDDAAIEAALASSDVVQQEDERLCSKVQVSIHYFISVSSERSDPSPSFTGRSGV